MNLFIDLVETLRRVYSHWKRGEIKAFFCGDVPPNLLYAQAYPLQRIDFGDGGGRSGDGETSSPLACAEGGAGAGRMSTASTGSHFEVENPIIKALQERISTTTKNKQHASLSLSPEEERLLAVRDRLEAKLDTMVEEGIDELEDRLVSAIREVPIFDHFSLRRGGEQSSRRLEAGKAPTRLPSVTPPSSSTLSDDVEDETGKGAGGAGASGTQDVEMTSL